MTFVERNVDGSPDRAESQFTHHARELNEFASRLEIVGHKLMDAANRMFGHEPQPPAAPPVEEPRTPEESHVVRIARAAERLRNALSFVEKQHRRLTDKI